MAEGNMAVAQEWLGLACQNGSFSKKEPFLLFLEALEILEN